MELYAPVTHLALLLILASLTRAEERNGIVVDAKISNQDSLDIDEKPPDILIAIFGMQRQYFLPYLLGAVERFEYPKDRLALWVHEEVPVPSENALNEGTEKSPTFSHDWFGHFREKYHSASVSTKGMDDGNSGARIERHNELHEAALALGRDIQASAVLFLEPDCMLFDAGMLRDLQIVDGDIVAPLLASYTRYTNYWCAMDDNGNYLLSDACEKYRKYDEKGSVNVASVYSCYMVKNEKALTHLTFRAAAVSGLSKIAENNAANSYAALVGLVARRLDLRVVATNQRLYGYMIPPIDVDVDSFKDAEKLLNRDWDQLAMLQLFLYGRDRYDLLQPSIVVDAANNVTDSSPKKKTSLGGRALVFPSKLTNGLLSDIAQVFVINLDRRPDRMKRMQQSMEALGLQYTRFAAVDGRNLSEDKLSSLGITLLPDYRDPYRKRPMTRGEIGCFLSHYALWQQIAVGNKAVLILEDDIRFVPYFTTKLDQILDDLRRTLDQKWDLVYIGRKRMANADEPYVKGTIRLVHVDYSYWTLGYLITPQGAQKLLDARPLEKLVPVDEFLPIMFGRHPERSWSAHYPMQNLLAFSSVPLLVEPLFYTGEAEYVSDTEDSIIVGGTYLTKEAAVEKKGVDFYSEHDAGDDDEISNNIVDFESVGGSVNRDEL